MPVVVVFQVFVLFSCWFAAGLIGVRVLDPDVNTNADRATWVILGCVFGPLVLVGAAAHRIPWGTFDGILFPSSAPEKPVEEYRYREPAPEPLCDEHPDCDGDHDPDQLHLL